MRGRQRKAALFLVICMVLSMFNGIPVRAAEPEQALRFAWYDEKGHWSDEEDDWVLDGYEVEDDFVDYGDEDWDGIYNRGVETLNLYITKNDGSAVSEITVSSYGDIPIEDLENDDTEPIDTREVTCISDNPGFFKDIPLNFGEEGLFNIVA